MLLGIRKRKVMEMNETNMTNGAAAAQEQDNIHVRIDEKAVKKMAGEAIYKADGVLGVAGGITDVLKSGDDITKGITVSLGAGNKVSVSARLVMEYGKNVPDVIQNVSDALRDTLSTMASLEVDALNLEVADIMTEREYAEKYGKNRSMQQ